jgi:hypothetical protein
MTSLLQRWQTYPLFVVVVFGFNVSSPLRLICKNFKSLALQLSKCQ